MKVLVIYNPTSGRKKYKKDIFIRQFLDKYDINYAWHNTTPDGSFSMLNPGEYDRIIACGGDGTIKEVATWIIISKKQIPLGVIPIGSGNILAQSLHIPLNTRQALLLALSDNFKKIDIGLINNREYFLIAAGCGFDAKVIKNTSVKLKRLIGIFAYALGTLKSFFNIVPDKVFIKVLDQAKTYKAQSVFISNFAQYFNIPLNPEATINDGYLNVSIFKPITLKDVGIMVYNIVIKRKYEKDSRYEYFTAKEVYVLPLRKKMPTQIDGELVQLPYLDIQVLPQALTIFSRSLK